MFKIGLKNIAWGKSKILYFLILFIVVITFSGCNSSSKISDNTRQNRLSTAILIDKLDSYYKIGDDVKVKISFSERDAASKTLLLHPISNAVINAVVIDPKGGEYPVAISEKNMPLDPVDMNDVKNIKNYDNLNRYTFNFSDTKTEGTYSIKVTSKIDEFSSSAIGNFVVNKPSKLTLKINIVELYRFTEKEKKSFDSDMKAASVGMRAVAEIIKMADKDSNVNTGADTDYKVPEGYVDLVAEVGTDTGAAPNPEKVNFGGLITFPNGIIVDTTKEKFNPASNVKEEKNYGYDNNWKYSETKDGKAYYKNLFPLYLLGDYKFTTFIRSSSYLFIYIKSEDTSTEFILK